MTINDRIAALTSQVEERLATIREADPRTLALALAEFRLLNEERVELIELSQAPDDFFRAEPIGHHEAPTTEPTPSEVFETEPADTTTPALIARLDERAEEYRQEFLSDELTLADYLTCLAFLAEERDALEALPGAEDDCTCGWIFGRLAQQWDDPDYLPWVATWGPEDLDGAESALDWAHRSGRITARELVSRRAPIRAAGNLLSA